MSEVNQALNEAWKRINALGGTPRTRWDSGFNEGIGEALTVIEALGGRDPATLGGEPIVGWTPTLALRFMVRQVAVPSHLDPMSEKTREVRILQQMFEQKLHAGTMFEWRDVESVDE